MRTAPQPRQASRSRQAGITARLLLNALTTPPPPATSVRRWGDGHLMIDLSVGAVGEQHAVRVTISGLYAVADEDVFDRSDDEQTEFARRQMSELIPFLRQAVYNASSQVWPVKPILLAVRSGKVHERVGAEADV